MQRQELVAEFAIERFVGAILPWLPRIDQRRLDAGLVQPPQDRARDEIRWLRPAYGWEPLTV